MTLDEEILEYGKILYPIPEPFMSVGWHDEEKYQQWAEQSAKILENYEFKCLIAFHVYHHLKNMWESAIDVGSTWCIGSTNDQYHKFVKEGRWAGEEIYPLKDRVLDIMSLDHNVIEDRYFYDILDHMRKASKVINITLIPADENKGGDYKVIYNIYHTCSYERCLKHFQQKCIEQNLPLPSSLPNYKSGGGIYYCTYSVRRMILHSLQQGFIFGNNTIKTAEEIADECMPKNIKKLAYIYDIYARSIPIIGDYRITKDIVPERISSLRRDDGYKIDSIDNGYILQHSDTGSKWHRRFYKYYEAVSNKEITTSLDLVKAIINDTKLAWENRYTNESEFRRLFEMRNINIL